MVEEHFENYGIYGDLIKNGHIHINANDITKVNYDSHFNAILSIIRDGVEDNKIQQLKIYVTLSDGYNVTFTLTDYWFNLIFWTIIIFLNEPITVTSLFDTRAITKDSIKDYFDTVIKRHSTRMNFMELNNIIDDTLYKFKYINEFSMYLANTVNFKDTLDLMEAYPEFKATMHFDASNIPIGDVKAEGMDAAKTQIKYIKSHDHCLRDSFVSGEAISPKQYKEVAVNIGTKPDGKGGVFPAIINNSYMNGGVDNPEAYIIDSSVSRTAQILSKMNTGESGAFARILEANNLDTFFNPNENYSCNTKNYIRVFIKDKYWLKMFDKRYYKFNPDGVEYVLDKSRDIHLIGQTLYFRSPMTCASFARGHGICRKCYGNLYYVNRDINPGKNATDELTSKLTQKLLSAKHLLESSVIDMKWPEKFGDIFEVVLNMIKVLDDIDVEGYYISIDSNTIETDDIDDDENNNIQYDEYITSFELICPDGTVVNIHTAEDDNIYLTSDLNRAMKNKRTSVEDGVYTIPLTILQEIPAIFTVKIQNKELQATLIKSKQMINKESITSSFTKDEIVSEFININAEGGINVCSVHLETLLAAQIRHPDDILSMPHWEVPDAPYRILTLNSALTNNPSPTVSLEFQKIARTLVNPITSRKKKASVMDMFFMEHPQDYVVDREMISNAYKMIEDTEIKIPKDAIKYVSKDKIINND